ncbi:MAG: thioredoxin domain-containing protein [Deltaproteobacteria bacterium]|nr:thioredoxin domain-containing protein [Deltaproteobacteria bacterium]
MNDSLPTNHLKSESSLYLQQHAHNPVDWYPWGEQAFQKARSEKKPIFLSIGYSACHWCHVMERESFEDSRTATLLNKHFINIKVDREEHPELDRIYMTAVQLLIGQGGWPLSVFLTPDLQPFYGGTYFPPEDRPGFPSFIKIIAAVASAWEARKDNVVQAASELTGTLHEMEKVFAPSQGNAPPSVALLDNAVGISKENYDTLNGGFGKAPKFFHSMEHRICLRHWKRTQDRRSLEMAVQTLDQMAKGGICDQIGGGFHRYSTDGQWLVPHFEKMLYDNALLIELYLEAFQATCKQTYKKMAKEILEYVAREMTSSEGVFFSTQDADSEGEEGKFYTWSYAELQQVLEKETLDPLSSILDLAPSGNWEGKIIPRIIKPFENWTDQELGIWNATRPKLFEYRKNRIAPSRDEKLITMWNALMIASMAFGYRVLNEEKWLNAARRAARFILSKLVRYDGHTGTLFHTYKDGKASIPGFLDDYAALITALVALYESDFDERWLNEALALSQTMVLEFWDESAQTFFSTGSSHKHLIVRMREFQDSALPSGVGLAATACIKLGRLTDHSDLLEKARNILKTYEPAMQKNPQACGQLLIALSMLIERPSDVVVVAGQSKQETDQAIWSLWKPFEPNRLVTLMSDKQSTLIPMHRGKKALEGKTTLYFCEGGTCLPPVVSVP